MPFSSTSIKSGPYVRNGVTTVFPFGFMALSSGEVEVVSIAADDAVTVLAGYTVSGVGDEGAGSVTFAVAPSASADALWVRAKPHLYQDTDLEDQAVYSATDTQGALDRLAQAVLWVQANSGGGGGGGGGGPVAWIDITGKPATFTPTAHAHATGDVTGLGEYVQDTVAASLVAGTNMGIVYNDAAGTITLNASGGGGGGGGEYLLGVPSLLDYSGVGNNVVDNVVCFTAAELDPDVDWIYVPEGTFYTTTAISSLRKHYWGPGKIRLSAGDVLPGRFSQLASPGPTPGTTGAAGWFNGDNQGVDPEYIRIEDLATRKNLTAIYYDGATIPHNVWFTNYAGWSGASGHLSAGVAAGVSTVTIKGDTTGFTVGDVVGFTTQTTVGASGVAMTFTDTVTITGKTSTTLTFTPALGNAYPLNAVVTHGPRTMHLHTYIYARNFGGGDAYGHMSRVQQNYVRKPSQIHWAETSTVGQYGGDLIFNVPGCYGTGWESYYADQGHDSAVIGQVDTFVRSNDTAAFGGHWLGIYLTSTGSKAADAGVVVSGLWRVGLDLTRGDFSLNSNAAIQMAQGHRIYFDAAVNLAGRGSVAGSPYGILYGNQLGGSYMVAGSDGSGRFLDAFCQSTYRTKVRENGTFSFNGIINAASDINGGQDIVATRDLGAVGKLRVGMLNSPVYLYWDGANLRATKNSGAASVIII